MNCVNPVRLKPTPLVTDGLLVPCGKCISCRIQKRKELSLRCLHELDYWKDKSMFVTLTYADEYLPEYGSLVKTDLQKWLKRLRKRIEPRKIRYLACGEYGDTTNRPHYHGIIYGLGLSPDDKQCVIDTWPYANWNVPTIKRKSFGLVEPHSIQYVAGYIDKKYTGELAEMYYKILNREPVFRLMSQGLGKHWVDQNADQIKDMQHVTMWGVPHSLPRYYIKRLDINTEQLKKRAEEREREIVERLTGVYATSDELWRCGNTGGLNVILATKKHKAKKQIERELVAKGNLKKRDYE